MGARDPARVAAPGPACDRAGIADFFRIGQFARMEWLRQRKRALATLAALVLVTKLALALLCHWAPAKATGGIVDDVLGAMELCTGHPPGGLEGAGGADGEGGPRSSPVDHCPVCALNKVPPLLVVLLVSLLLLRAPRVSRWQWQVVRLLPDHLGFGTVRSRAPPLPA